MTPILGLVALTLSTALALLWRRQLALRRDAYIRSFELPRGLFEQLRKRRPELPLKDCQLVAHALRQFLLAHLKSGLRRRPDDGAGAVMVYCGGDFGSSTVDGSTDGFGDANVSSGDGGGSGGSDGGGCSS